MTLTQFGAVIGIDSANLSKIENGKREFDGKKLYKLASSFNLNLENLKEEFYSDIIARTLFKNKCTLHVLDKAQEKYNYLKYKQQKQAQLEF